MSHWTLVPQRGLGTGKTRLKGVLAPRQRLALNAMLLHRALDAVAACEGGLGRCIVASAGEETLALARARGALPLADRPGAGLNAALERARAHARAQGAGSILVLPADLPWVSGAALARLRAAVAPGRCAVVADKHGSGTNGLLLPAGLELAFAFGAASLGRHVAGCRALGQEPLVWRDEALALDLDLPVDYRAWRAQGGGEASAHARRAG